MADRERLKVIDAARRFAEIVIELSKSLPRSAPPGLRTQLAESAQAVSAMLAEGLARGTTGEKIHYSNMGNGSLEECQNHLRECINLHLIDKKKFYKAWNLSVALSRMLIAFIAHYQREAQAK